MSLEQDLAAAVRTWVDALSPHTRRAYERGLMQFAEYLTAIGRIDPPGPGHPTGTDDRAPMRRDAMQERNDLLGRAGEHLLSLGAGGANGLVQAYLEHLTAIDEQTGLPAFTRETIKQRASALRWAVREARRRGLVSWGLDVIVPRAQKDPETGRIRVKPGRSMRGPGPTVVANMLALAATRASRDGGRWHLIVSLIVHETLREHEVCALDLVDLDLDRRAVSVVRKKDEDYTLLPLSGPTTAALQAWLEHRGTEPGPLLWGSARAKVVPGSRLTVGGVYYVIHTLGDLCGVDTSPHKVRHTAITLGQQVREQLDISIQDGMARAGHKHPDTHHRYLDPDLEQVRRLSDGVARLLREQENPAP